MSAQNIDCGYLLEPPRRGSSNEYPQSMFLSRNIKKYQIFYLKISIFLVVKFSAYLNRLVFIMESSYNKFHCTSRNPSSAVLDMGLYSLNKHFMNTVFTLNIETLSLLIILVPKFELVQFTTCR